MLQVVDYKKVDMSDEEYGYYQKLIVEFTSGTNNGKEQFRDLFDVDGDGCIIFIHPPIRKQIAWGVIFFIQNLMISQHLRRMEQRVNDWMRRLENKHD